MLVFLMRFLIRCKDEERMLRGVYITLSKVLRFCYTNPKKTFSHEKNEA